MSEERDSESIEEDETTEHDPDSPLELGDTIDWENNERLKELYEQKGFIANTSLVNTERPRGILSKTDREYLIGEKDYKHPQSEANRRQEIRNRVENTFLDFYLLNAFLENSERDQIFTDLNEHSLHQALSSVITFLYLGLDQDKERMESILERGILSGANFDQSGRWAGEAMNVDVEINIDYMPDTDQLYERLQKEQSGHGEKLSPAEVGILVRDGKLTPEDLENIRHIPEPPVGAPDLMLEIISASLEAGAEIEDID